MSNYVSLINIPAYDAFNRGLIVQFKLSIFPNEMFQVKAKGAVALALRNNFIRIIEIMASLKQSWVGLESMGYLLECSANEFLAKDAKSSSMALCIALINANRAINGKPQISGFSGTGVLRIDGSFDRAHLEDDKYLAAKKIPKSIRRFITPGECPHLFDLEKLINQSQ